MGCLKSAVCTIVIAVLSAINAVNIQAADRTMSSEIIINIPSYTIEYYENNKLIKEYPVAIGKPSTPTPLGLFYIIDKEIDPSWYPPERNGDVVSSGPDNPLGYRWMGFEGNYGIHGTNAPWSIGSAISNGCIRMHEENVEELFLQIEYNTPVYITYDQMKVRVDKTGKASIGIYPDVYEYGKITLEQVKQRLITEGLDNLVEDNFLSQLISEEKGEQIVFAELHNLIINNNKSQHNLLEWDDVVFTPVLAPTAHLGTNREWNKQQQLVIGKQHLMPGIVNYNILYVNDLTTLFDVRQNWYEYKCCLKINAMELLMAGQLVSHTVQQINDMHYVPLFKVAKAIGSKLYWEEQSKSLWLGNKKISVTMLVEQPYSEDSIMSSFLNGSVSWGGTQKTKI